MGMTDGVQTCLVRGSVISPCSPLSSHSHTIFPFCSHTNSRQTDLIAVQQSHRTMLSRAQSSALQRPFHALGRDTRYCSCSLTGGKGRSLSATSAASGLARVPPVRHLVVAAATSSSFDTQPAIIPETRQLPEADERFEVRRCYCRRSCRLHSAATCEPLLQPRLRRACACWWRGLRAAWVPLLCVSWLRRASQSRRGRPAHGSWGWPLQRAATEQPAPHPPNHSPTPHSNANT